MMDIDKTVEKVHEDAKQQGWWVNPPRPLEIHALIVTEIAEATEAVRKGREKACDTMEHLLDLGQVIITPANADEVEYLLDTQCNFTAEQMELADTVMRIMDYFGANGWSLSDALRWKMRANRLRRYKHGGKDV